MIIGHLYVSKRSRPAQSTQYQHQSFNAEIFVAVPHPAWALMKPLPAAVVRRVQAAVHFFDPN
jgi:hypothetical protein